MRLNPDDYVDDDEGPESSGQPGAKARNKPSHLGRAGRVQFLTDAAAHRDKVNMDLHEGFVPTFHASEHERGWTVAYLEEFYNRQIITDVLGKVKGGKEANVYCCAAGPETGVELIAAKIYRPRMFRNLRNDAQYRQGRELLDEEGKVSHARREVLAMRKNTRYGKVLRHISWLQAEYNTLRALHAAGADIPKPLAQGENVILMEFVGAQDLPAPNLNQVNLSRGQARSVFARLIENVEIMLACHTVHADLSAYNVLFWDGAFKIIDFPQAVDPRRNADAQALFNRDVARVCQHFTRYGITTDADTLARRLWERYAMTNALDAAASPDEEE